MNREAVKVLVNSRTTYMEGGGKMSLELRFIEMSELRSEADGKTLFGYAAVFNSLSADLGGFQERIMPGAFTSALSGARDIRALVDHDPTKLLGRTSNKTLRVSQDDKGLRVEIDMPETSYAADVRSLVQRGDIKGMSFGFYVPDGGERFTKAAGQTIRELTAIDLREVTVTSIPAYGDTSVSVRIDPGVMERAGKHSEKSSQPNLANLKRLLQTIS